MNPSENQYQWLARIRCCLDYDLIFWQHDEHRQATHRWQCGDLDTR
jgi:hypothetical protein